MADTWVIPTFSPTQYKAAERDDKTFRAFRDQVMIHLHSNGKLIDVRSPEEYSGQRLHMEAYPNEGALRGGHIPGAKSGQTLYSATAFTGTLLGINLASVSFGPGSTHAAIRRRSRRYSTRRLSSNQTSS